MAGETVHASLSLANIDTETVARRVIDTKGADTEAQNELDARARAGDGEALGFLAHWFAGLAIGSGNDGYLPPAEFYARHAAGLGSIEDQNCLVGILAYKAARLRALHQHEQAQAAEVECLVWLTLLADAGWEDAGVALNLYTEQFAEESIHQAAAEAKIIRAKWDADAVADAKAAASQKLLDSLPPLTRWQRLRFWLSDRYWDARLAWWDLRDWISARFERPEPVVQEVAIAPPNPLTPDRIKSARLLASSLAAHHGMNSNELAAELFAMSPDALALLDSPCGWHALADALCKEQTGTTEGAWRAASIH